MTLRCYTQKLKVICGLTILFDTSYVKFRSRFLKTFKTEIVSPTNYYGWKARAEINTLLCLKVAEQEPQLSLKIE